MLYKIINKKNVLLLLSVSIGLPLLFMTGCRALVKNIYQSMDCDQFNIDHIELRTGINIPSVQRNYCELIDSVRSVSFQVLLNTEELEIYSAKYFEWNTPVFTAEGERSDTRWEASLDTSSRALNFNLYYLKDE
jgi:hypothetical protein